MIFIGAGSFFAPCSLPLLPGAVAVIIHSVVTPAASRIILLAAGLFVLSYSVAFATASSDLGLASDLLREQTGVISLFAGGSLTLFGAALLGTFGKRLQDRASDSSGVVTSAIVLGITSGVLWIQCVGSGLGAALTAAATPSTAEAGSMGLLMYGLGIGIPLMLLAAAVASSVS